MDSWWFRCTLRVAAFVLPCGAIADDRLAEIEARLRGRPEEALAALQPEINRAKGTGKIELLVLRGWMHAKLSDGDAVERTALELEQAGPQPLAGAAAAMVRGRGTARRGPLGRADRQLADAAERLPRSAPPELQLRLLDAQAKVKQSLGRLDDAVRLYQASVELADRHGPAWRRSEQRNALAYTLYLAQQVDRAREVNREALALAIEASDALAHSGAKNVEGMVVGALGRKAEELQAMRAAIELAQAAGAQRDAVLGMANLSDYYLKQGDAATALKLAREALPLARAVKDPMVESVALANTGLALIALNRRDEGVGMVREALLVEERAGALTQMSAIQEELGLTLEKAGHLREAWTALAEHRRLADEVFQREQQQAVLELQEGFEAEHRRRDVALLQTEMRLKEAQLTGRDLQQRLWAVALLAGVLLLAVVGLLVRRMRDSNARLSDSNAQLKVASESDPLTGLANRHHFHAVMQRDAAAAFAGSLLLIDIDHFKHVNDRHGHAAGDAVLVEAARRLRDALRSDDLTVRWGGEEFLVCVRDLPADQVEALAERLLGALGGRPVQHRGESIAVTASIGFATFPLQPLREAVRWERAIDLVDTAMYLAKAHGRNRAYGVRSLQAEAAADTTLEQAWRSGRADLRLLSGPAALEPRA